MPRSISFWPHFLEDSRFPVMSMLSELPLASVKPNAAVVTQPVFGGAVGALCPKAEAARAATAARQMMFRYRFILSLCLVVSSGESGSVHPPAKNPSRD